MSNRAITARTKCAKFFMLPFGFSSIGYLTVMMSFILGLFIILAVVSVSNSYSLYKDLNEKIIGYSKEPTEEKFKKLDSAYEACRATWRCSSTIDGELESNEFNTQLLFDSLVSNNKLDYAQKIGFFDEDGLWGRSGVWKEFTLHYQGTNYEINSLKATRLIRLRKYKSAYETLTNMFVGSNDSWNKNVVAGKIRGLLLSFNCKNDAVIWEAYSIEAIKIENSFSSDKMETPLSNDQLKVARAAFDNGGVPELQESCSLKHYKL